MKSYALTSDGGGTGKTTIGAGLIKAHQLAGKRVLAIDIDKQTAGLTAHYGLKHCRDADLSLLDFMAKDRYADGRDLTEVIRTVEVEEVGGEKMGIDIIPSHNSYRRMQPRIDSNEHKDVRSHPHKQLRRVLAESNIHEHYDVLVIDSPASSEMAMDNAVFAARNILVPAELSPKGDDSMDGMLDLIRDLRSAWEFNLSILGVVPNKMKGMNINNDIQEKLERNDLTVAPATFRNLQSMFYNSWKEGVSVFKYIEDVKEYPADRETDQLEEFEKLERFVWNRLNGMAPEEAVEAANIDRAENPVVKV